MAYCDFCDCQLCQTGEGGGPGFSHAPTVHNFWVCDICYEYTICIKEAGGYYPIACDEFRCTHRPILIGDFVK